MTSLTRQARCEHRDILQKVLPFVAQVATHLDAETQRLRKASKDESSQVPSRPEVGHRQAKTG